MKDHRKCRRNIRKIVRNNKAITLIALVVTIVVLLILAGVSISMLGGENGIIKQAQDSKEDTRGAEVKEVVDLAINNNKILDYANTTGEKETKEDVIDKLKAEGKLTDEEIIDIAEDNKVTIGDIEIDFSGLDGTIDGGSGGGTETTLPLPENAVISKIPGEYESEDEGIVIYIMKDADGDGIIDTPDWTDVEKMQTTYDQFVWVPVPNAIAVDKDGNGTIDETDIDRMIEVGEYPMAIATDATNYRGVLYDFSEATGEDGKKYVSVSDKSYSATSGYREPAYLENSSYADGSSYNTVGITQNSLQTEFNTMVNKVNSNKGFWVGRYETSNMNGESSTKDNSYDSTQQIEVVKGATEGVSDNNINWYRMYAQQKNYSKLALGTSTTATSSMIWGSQRDQIMIWMKEVKNTVNTANGEYYVTNSIGMGNYGTITGVDDGYSNTSSPAPTGCFDVKNIYDLAGNLLDWSLEAYSAGYRVLRRRRLL